MTGARLSYIPEYKVQRAIKMLKEGFTHAEIHKIININRKKIAELDSDLKNARLKIDEVQPKS